MCINKVWLLQAEIDGKDGRVVAAYSSGSYASDAARMFMIETACKRGIYELLTAPIPEPRWKTRKNSHIARYEYGGIHFRLFIRPLPVDTMHLDDPAYLHRRLEREHHASPDC
jgi:hypothetical protein